MKNFKWTKSLMNILGGLKSNVGIFRGTIYLFNPWFYYIGFRVFYEDYNGIDASLLKLIRIEIMFVNSSKLAWAHVDLQVAMNHDFEDN